MSGRGPKAKPSKVVVRKLPPDVTQASFLASFESACAAMNFAPEQRGLVHYLPGKVSTKRGTIPSAGFVWFSSLSDAQAFVNRCPSEIPFLEGEAQPHVTLAPQQKVFKTRVRPDARAGTIFDDEDFLAFKARVEEGPARLQPVEQRWEQQHQQSQQPKSNPLLDYLREKAKKKKGKKNLKDKAKEKKKETQRKAKAAAAAAAAAAPVAAPTAAASAAPPAEATSTKQAKKGEGKSRSKKQATTPVAVSEGATSEPQKQRSAGDAQDVPAKHKQKQKPKKAKHPNDGAKAEAASPAPTASAAKASQPGTVRIMKRDATAATGAAATSNTDATAGGAHLRAEAKPAPSNTAAADAGDKAPPSKGGKWKSRGGRGHAGAATAANASGNGGAAGGESVAPKNKTFRYKPKSAAQDG